MKPIYKDILVFAIVALLSGTIGWIIKPCPTCLGATVIEVHDSIAPSKDTGIIAINTQPKLKETKKYTGRQNYSYTSDTNKINCLVGDTVSDHDFSYTNSCIDTNIFTVDTQAVDNFKARATATVTNNQLISLLIEYQNFKPEKWKVLSKIVTIEKKQALVKVFPEVYARANFNAVTATGGGAGGGASFVVKDMHLIGIDAGANKSIGQPIDGEVLLRYGVKLQLKK